MVCWLDLPAHGYAARPAETTLGSSAAKSMKYEKGEKDGKEKGIYPN